MGSKNLFGDVCWHFARFAGSICFRVIEALQRPLTITNARRTTAGRAWAVLLAYGMSIVFGTVVVKVLAGGQLVEPKQILDDFMKAAETWMGVAR